MNVYTTQFAAECPTNGEQIIYSLAITSEATIYVESIKAEILAATSDAAYHEEIADRLHERLGGSQVLEATHHGVSIKTIRPQHWNRTDPDHAHR